VAGGDAAKKKSSPSWTATSSARSGEEGRRDPVRNRWRRSQAPEEIRDEIMPRTTSS